MKRLPEREKGAFLERLRDVDFEDAWDRQIDQDARAGRLDNAWQQALNDIHAGRTKPLDQVIDNA